MINKMLEGWVELYCEKTGKLITRRRSQGNDGVAGWEVDRHNEQCDCYRSHVVDNDYEPPTT